MPTYIYDGSLVMVNLMNAAADLGVASCGIHRANDEFVKLSTLIIAMQSYGSSAQQYFNRLEKPH